MRETFIEQVVLGQITSDSVNFWSLKPCPDSKGSIPQWILYILSTPNACRKLPLPPFLSTTQHSTYWVPDHTQQEFCAVQDFGEEEHTLFPHFTTTTFTLHSHSRLHHFCLPSPNYTTFDPLGSSSAVSVNHKSFFLQFLSESYNSFERIKASLMSRKYWLE